MSTSGQGAPNVVKVLARGVYGRKSFVASVVIPDAETTFTTIVLSFEAEKEASVANVHLIFGSLLSL